jgi:multidrug efflux pump
MASAVATPLERQLSRIAGVTQLTSTNQVGATAISIQFDLSRSSAVAEREIQAAISAARSQLPSELPWLPDVRNFNPADPPILYLGMTSDNVDIPDIYTAADSVVGQRLSQTLGVGEVFIGGVARPSVRVQANPALLNNYGISLESVRAVLNSANVDRPKGEIDGAERAWGIATNDQLFTAREYKPLIVSWRNGAPIRLSDVANVIDSAEDLRTAAFIDGKPGVILVVYRQPGANIVQTIDRVRQQFPILQASINPSIHLSVVVDRSLTIRASIHDVERALVISICLVILVVFLFLRSVRATLIPGLAVPLSIVGTFALLFLCGFNLDNLSLMALTISTGFVVDDAIVVVENIMRHLDAGASRIEAARRGASEVGFTVLSMSLSLIAVFIPILFLGGVVGLLFHEFAVTLSFAIAVSLLVSLTTTPALCAMFLRRSETKNHGFLPRALERCFQAVLHGYGVCLRWTLRYPLIMLGATVLTIVASVWLYMDTPKGFFPVQDTSRMLGLIRADQDISFTAMKDKVRDFEEVVRADPAVESVLAFTGGDGATSSGTLYLQLKPIEERQLSARQVMGRLRPKLGQVIGATLYMSPVQDISFGGKLMGPQYQLVLQDESLSELYKWAPKLEERMEQLADVRDVNSDQYEDALQASVTVDRDTAARLGVSMASIDNTLNDAFSSRQVSNILTQRNQYHVVLELLPEYQKNPESLSAIYVASDSGKLVPLSALAHFEKKTTALTINHSGPFPAVTMSFNLAPGVSLGTAVEHIQKLQRDLTMPSSVHARFVGVAQQYKDSVASEPWLIFCALAAVYIVLGILYESFIHPITILSTLPSAGVGALLAIRWAKSDLGIISVIGIILLIGIVKKNAILVIDFALQREREDGVSSRDAIYQACLLRFRPITMTTMTAVFGALPLAIGTGMGSELRQPLGLTIVGGLIVSQLLTLFSTPVVYLHLDRLQNWIRGVGAKTVAHSHAQSEG